MQLNKTIRQLLLYMIVGALATVVEWTVFYILDMRCGMHYAISVAIAFILSTFANWVAGRLILFHKGNMSVSREILCIYMTSIAGLFLNLLIMYILIDRYHTNDMLSKIIATGVVFMWNFLVRKKIIYKV